jgi:hypothetical protein
VVKLYTNRQNKQQIEIPEMFHSDDQVINNQQIENMNYRNHNIPPPEKGRLDHLMPLPPSKQILA